MLFRISMFAGSVFLLAGASAVAADSYRLNAGDKAIITEFTVSKFVTNDCANDIFIPTKTSAEWAAFVANKPACVTAVTPDTCTGTPAAGTVCDDGTIFVGTYNGFKYKTTPGDCTNSSTPTCDFSNDTLQKQWSPTLVSIGASSWSDGVANTATIVAAYPAADTAAKYCDDLNYGGATDWFLPASNELDVIHASGSSIAGYRSTGVVHYWSSSESSATNGDTNWSSGGKNVARYFRCVRKY